MAVDRWITNDKYRYLKSRVENSTACSQVCISRVLLFRTRRRVEREQLGDQALYDNVQRNTHRGNDDANGAAAIERRSPRQETTGPTSATFGRMLAPT